MPRPTDSLESLAQEVLQLPPEVRPKLLDRVVESLDADRARDAAWDALAAQRDAEVESGAAQPPAVAQVLARLRTELETPAGVSAPRHAHGR